MQDSSINFQFCKPHGHWRLTLHFVFCNINCPSLKKPKEIVWHKDTANKAGFCQQPKLVNPNKIGYSVMLELSPDRDCLWPFLYLVCCKIGPLDPNTKARRRRKLKASYFTVQNYVLFCFVPLFFFFSFFGYFFKLRQKCIDITIRNM